MAIRASDYFRGLGELLLSMQASDAQGSPLLTDLAAERAAGLIAAARQGRRKIVIVGNGGSAAIASHVHNDLSKTIGVRSVVLTEPPLLTALSNDLGYAAAYEFGIGLWADPGDLCIAISSGGKSENILRAVSEGKKKGMTVLTLSGFGSDNPLRASGDLNFYVAAPHYGHVELSHSCLLHFLTDRAAEMLSERKGQG